jgi:hypothetical protein
MDELLLGVFGSMRHLIPSTNRCAILCSTFGPVGSMNRKYASAENVISHRDSGGPEIFQYTPCGSTGKEGSSKSRPVIQSTARRKQPPNPAVEGDAPPAAEFCFSVVMARASPLR